MTTSRPALTSTRDQNTSDRATGRHLWRTLTMASAGLLVTLVAAQPAEAPTQDPSATTTEAPAPVITEADGVRTVQQSANLSDGDERNDFDKLNDPYVVIVDEGERLIVDVTSSDFDTYLTLTSPSGRNFINDDFEGSTEHSRIDLAEPETGDWIVQVSAFGDGTGDYEVVFTTAPAPELEVVLEQDGSLDTAADTPQYDGRIADHYTLKLRAGTRLLVNMESEDFTPMLSIATPDGDYEMENGFFGDNPGAMLDFTAEEDGDYRLFALNAWSKESGDYHLQVRRVVEEGETEAP